MGQRRHLLRYLSKWIAIFLWFQKRQPTVISMNLFMSPKQRSADVMKNLSLSLYLQYYAEACNELAGLISSSLYPGQHSFFRRNLAAVASRRQHCVQFDRPEIWTSDLPLQRRTRYRSTNWPVMSWKRTCNCVRKSLMLIFVRATRN